MAYGLVDDDGIPYDISGVDDSDTNDYIPEFMMESTVKDFRHVPGVVNNTTDQKIARWFLIGMTSNQKCLAVM